MSRVPLPYTQKVLDLFRNPKNLGKMDDANVIAIAGNPACGDMITSQLDRFRPTPELSNYRTPIQNFYLCGSACHNGVGTGRGSSYNCYQVIREDFF